VCTEVTTERPGLSRDFQAPRLLGSKLIRTVTRCTTLVKLPVALSGGEQGKAGA